MLNEYDVVRLKHTVPAVPLPPGTKGTVLIVHSSNPQAYEIEFMDEEGESLGTYTVNDIDLEVVWKMH